MIHSTNMIPSIKYISPALLSVVLLAKLHTLHWNHPYFIPSYVRWPVVMIMVLFTLLSILWHVLPLFLIAWSNDLQIESNEGRMTLRVQKTITNGFKIFLISEVMIFFSLIWAFIHLGLVTTIWLFMNWAP